uniref:Putative casein kinase II subunit beta-4 n=1 Tax=Rhizophora mucronata TaxID=61149 RepID=A0A2P2MJ62_RHIMU
MSQEFLASRSTNPRRVANCSLFRMYIVSCSYLTTCMCGSTPRIVVRWLKFGKKYRLSSDETSGRDMGYLLAYF